jgi:hypothetical protein
MRSKTTTPKIVGDSSNSKASIWYMPPIIRNNSKQIPQTKKGIRRDNRR